MGLAALSGSNYWVVALNHNLVIRAVNSHRSLPRAAPALRESYPFPPPRSRQANNLAGEFMRPSLSDRLRASPTSNIMVEAADHIDAQAAEIAQARQTANYWKAEHNAANAEIARMREALAEISEYWNRDQNDEAMHDACWHAINTANAALSGEGK